MADYAPNRKVGGEWKAQTPFQRTPTGWKATKMIYKKVSGSWVQIFNSAPPIPTGTVTASLTSDGFINVNQSTVTNSPESVVIHVGTSILNSAPIGYTDGYKSGKSLYRVFTTGSSRSFLYGVSNTGNATTAPVTSVTASTVYYVTMWAQDSVGTWYKLSACKLSTGKPTNYVYSYSNKTAIIRPSFVGTYNQDSKLFTKAGTAFTVQNPAANTVKYRGVFMYGSQIKDMFYGKGWPIDEVKVSVNRYPDKRTNGDLYFGVHENGWPTGSFLNGEMWTGSTFRVAQSNTSQYVVRSSAYDELISGEWKSFSLNLAFPDNTGYQGNAFYSGTSGVLSIKYRVPITGKRWPVVNSVPA